MGLSKKGRRNQTVHEKKKNHRNDEHFEHTEEQVEEEKLEDVEGVEEEKIEQIEIQKEEPKEIIELNEEFYYQIESETIFEVSNLESQNETVNEGTNEVPNETNDEPSNEVPTETSNETSTEVLNEVSTGTSNETSNGASDFQQHESQTKPQITIDNDIFDQFIDQYRGERRKYFRGTFLYGCFKNTYNFVTHLPIQRIFVPYFETAFDTALYFIGINGESKERNSIEELDILLGNYIDQIDQKVDSSKDHRLDQLKYLKGKIIANPVFQSKVVPVIQSSYHTVSEISTKIPFLNR